LRRDDQVNACRPGLGAKPNNGSLHILGGGPVCQQIGIFVL
jgi:hypothetical protein